MNEDKWISLDTFVTELDPERVDDKVTAFYDVADEITNSYQYWSDKELMPRETWAACYADFTATGSKVRLDAEIGANYDGPPDSYWYGH